MRLVDLTHIPAQGSDAIPAVFAFQKTIGQGSSRYTANVYDFRYGGMYGTYLDLPGHIAETHDGRDAATVPIQTFYRMRATVAHFDVSDRPGAVTAEMLAKACPDPGAPEALVIHALGPKRFDDIEERSVYLAHDALGWILHTGCRLLVSDIYESKTLHGVFPRLFGAGISTVCHPTNLHEIDTPNFFLTVSFLPFPNVTQLPCRVVAEL